MNRIIILLPLVFSGCFYSGMDDDYSYIDPKIKPYVDSFVFEAKERGMIIHTENLKIAFGDLKGQCGGVTYDRYGIITIDSTSYNWRRETENTIFHELGHLYLHRGHNNELLPNNEPKSIMNDGSNPPRFKNNLSKRKYYLDELFSL